MNKIYKLMIAINLVFAAGSLLHARERQETGTNLCAAKSCQKEFIGQNGEIGIYQPNKSKAFIGDDSYIRVKAILTNGSRKLRKPSNSIPLGKLIDGQDIYELYGRDEHPAPVDDSPTGDVRTEQEIDYDFMRDFGSGKYTPGDKWD